MKKLLAILLAVVLCVSVCAVTVFASTPTEVELSVSADKASVTRGETVTVVVDMSKNTAGITSMMINVAYDANVLQVDANGPMKKITYENFYTKDADWGFDINNVGVNNTTGNPLKFAWAYTCAADYADYYQDYVGTAKLVAITFKVKDNAAFGNTAVSVSFDEKGLPSGLGAIKRAISTDAVVKNITIACVNHEGADPVVVEPAKCDKPGSQTISCKHCGYLMATEPIPQTGHAWGNWEGSAAAECGKPGEEKRVCANDPTHFETRATDALEHLWDDGVVTTPAGCDTPGEKTFTCQRDNTHTKTEPVAPTGHDWDDGVVTTPAGCDTPGETTYTCQNNPSHTKTEPIAPTGHNITWTVTTPPTLDKEGERTGTCGTCGAPFTEPMPKLTNKVDGDKVVGGVVGADGKITEADIDASFETTDDEPFTGYVQGSVIKAPVSTWTDAEKTAVEGKVGVVGFGVAIADTDNAANLDGDKVVKVTIKLDNALLSKYENLVAYAPDASGAMVVLSGAEIVDGNLVVTGKVSDLMGLAVAVYGDEIVVDSGKEPGKSPETGDSSAIAFAIVMMAIAAAAVVVTGKKVKA